MAMPRAEIAMPPHQHRAETTPALRGPLEPAAEQCGGSAEQHEEQRVDPDEVADAPVAACGRQRLEKRKVRTGARLLDADRPRQRQPEHAEAIGHADAEMDGERCRRDQPSVEAGPSDDPRAIEKSVRTPADTGGNTVSDRHYPWPPVMNCCRWGRLMSTAHFLRAGAATIHL
jgi:hypothetical protein